MTFGKPGRPPEDRLARQSEIYEAVSPLILKIGARQLSMRAAAHAAYLSVGGLYHHFPTKHELVLHGLQPETIIRRCHDFHDEFDTLINLDAACYLDAYVDSLVKSLLFARPAFHAALELGVETFNHVMEASFATATTEFAQALHHAIPEATKDEVYQAGRAVNRAMIAALWDKDIRVHEFRDELSALINGYFGKRLPRMDLDQISHRT